jgi:hypothetical protein
MLGKAGCDLCFLPAFGLLVWQKTKSTSARTISGGAPLDERTAIACLAAAYPRPRERDGRSARRRAIDANREMIRALYRDGYSLEEIAQELCRRGIAFEAGGRPLRATTLSTLLGRCGVVRGEPDPAAPRGAGRIAGKRSRHDEGA